MTHRELGSAARFDAAAEGETFRNVLGIGGAAAL